MMDLFWRKAFLAAALSAGLCGPCTAAHSEWSDAGDAPAPMFDSPELAQLLDTARVQSLDLAAAEARIRQAAAVAHIAGAALLPRVAGAAVVGREGRLGGGASVDVSSFSAGLTASYEVDFWGRNQAARESALQGLQASGFDRDTLRLTLAAGVANCWLQAVSLRERTEIAHSNLQSAKRLLALVESRSRAGAALPLELAQQRGLVASQHQNWTALRQQAEQAVVALGLLLGQDRPVPPRTGSLASLAPLLPQAGMPADLLARRPDIAAAEARLRAADADIAAARAALLPGLTLSAGAGWSSERLGQLLSNPLYALAGNLAATVFDGGRLRAGADLAQAQRDALLAAWRQAYLAAVADVHDALIASEGLDARFAAQAEVLRQAEATRRLAEVRYRAGAQSLLELLDAQRVLYTAQDLAARLHAERLQASVALYRALGGAWGLP